MNDMVRRARSVTLVLTDVDGVLTDAGMYYTEQGDELKKFSTLDGGGILLLKYAGIKTGIITGETTDIVMKRAQKIGVDYVFQGVIDKKSTFDRLITELHIRPEHTAYIGDDINDISLLETTGISATVPNNCLPKSCHVDYVTGRAGGCGAVRDFAEWLLNLRGDYEQALQLYLKDRNYVRR